ncbi:DNA repair protein recN [Candidatus Protochlamydia naegleriophila]|uniref:DNA repair protein RecN n=1 Tax=Candidatus Protochlamydia naegleriophila TaxID=389348 RepID=A0A0U5ESD2_9BACT|nr:DNA repair protein RecN [Candidatus Protochlamydia naegleriophila]CUI17120.1 DNA repair protein recN [Candidatus Protochlamydia naegleriophila]
MLKHLRIQNIILVENADISFSSGLNILTGETGSGKSAIMHGLSLAIGERADTSLIRKGCDKGVVEAIFDLDLLNLTQLLAEGGIEHEHGQELIIRREISLSGKSRVFINNQLAHASFLRKFGSQIVRIVGQHANQTLLSLDYHREVLDLYGSLSTYVQEFQTSYELESDLKTRLDQLVQQEAQRLREIDICQRELEELDEAQLKAGEDEELFAEYTLLFNAEELAEKIQEINLALSGERQAILTALNRQKQTLESLVSFDPHLQETAQAFQNAMLELQEISHTLRHYQSRLNHDPERLHIVNERLTLLNRLKRKYGSTLDDILTYQTVAQEKLLRLENADAEIETLQAELQIAEAKTNHCAQILSDQRQQFSTQLQEHLTSQLHSLNMSKAEFKVSVTPQKRTQYGDDKIEFFLQPNVGEHQIALKDGASGGEISRVLLALQTLLAGKEQTSTLIFDEVDANIGGETATIVGDKLKEIGLQHQVICITHFPQVANLAHHHIQISKVEKEGRTITQIQELDPASRQQELARMAGFKTIQREQQHNASVLV